MKPFSSSRSKSRAADSSHELVRVGNNQTPIIIIDNFYPKPQSLLDIALSGEAFSENHQDFYPGKRKVLNAAHYRAHFLKYLTPLLHDLYPDVQGKQACQLHSVFSITTTNETELRPIQTIPHIDTHDSQSFAAVHYLCEPPFEGTSFYRHKSTGVERIDSDGLKDYFATAKKEMMIREFEPHYRYGSDDLYQRIYQVALAFNRIVVYPSNLLHSGDIRSELIVSEQADKARLTLNSFIAF